MKITMQDWHLCCPPSFSLAPQCAPRFFHSRIATAPALSKRGNRDGGAFS